MINRYAVISSTKGGDHESVALPNGWKPVVLPIFDTTNTHKSDDQIYHSTLFKILSQYDFNIPQSMWDLLVIAISLHVADTRIQRTPNSQDGWTREIALYIPVHNPDLWDTLKQLLQSIFAFLTGDIWYIEFRQSARKWELPKKRKLIKLETNSVCLFSGGLDSFVGAIDLIEEGLNPLLVGYSGGSIESGPQNKCFEILMNQYKIPKNSFAQCYIRFPKSVPKDILKGKERSQRGRSFLFFALGTLFSLHSEQKTSLYVPENGLISLNIPLTSSRVGSASTRTTHPFYMNKFQKLLDCLDFKVSIRNPYKFKTKGEMLLSCKNPYLLKDSVHNTMSCSHPNDPNRGGGIKACGTCIPDLIRRASIMKLCEDTTPYRITKLHNVVLNSKGDGQGIRAFQIMLERIKKNPEITKLLIHKTGPLGDEQKSIPEYQDVFKRGLEEVGQLIMNTKTRPK